MVLFIILGVIVLITFIALGVLFHLLNKEAQNKDQEKAVPLMDLNQLKTDITSQTLEGQNPNVLKPDPEIIPAFVPKESLATQEAQPSLEEDTYKRRIQELEDELHAFKQKAEEQADVAREMIVTLSKENQTLKSQQADLDETQAKLAELESTKTKVNLLEEELGKAKAAVTAAQKPVPDEDLRPELESLKTEGAQLKQKCEGLEYELVKAKAQSSGLDRVSFNYKNQIEDFLKKIKELQAANDQLSQVKGKMEEMMAQVKLQNEELVKKDQLTQFELEQNRSRLVILERDYEDLKARTQLKDQQ